MQTIESTKDYITRMQVNRARLRLLSQLSLLRDKEVIVYDRLTVLASQMIGTPIALMSMVVADHQFFKSHTGLPEPWKTKRATPLSHSFCQHVVISNQPLIVEDARQNKLLKDNLAIPDLNVIGYLGIPLTLSTGLSLGSFCVIDDKPRQWTQVEIGITEQLAEILVFEFETRIQVNLRHTTLNELYHLQANILTLMEMLDYEQGKSRLLAQVKRLRTEFDLIQSNDHSSSQFPSTRNSRTS